MPNAGEILKHKAGPSGSLGLQLGRLTHGKSWEGNWGQESEGMAQLLLPPCLPQGSPVYPSSLVPLPSPQALQLLSSTSSRKLSLTKPTSSLLCWHLKVKSASIWAPRGCLETYLVLWEKQESAPADARIVRGQCPAWAVCHYVSARVGRDERWLVDAIPWIAPGGTSPCRVTADSITAVSSYPDTYSYKSQTTSCGVKSSAMWCLPGSFWPGWGGLSGVSQPHSSVTDPNTLLPSTTSPPTEDLVAQTVKNLPTMQETQVQSLDQEDPLEKGMATPSSVLVWRIPWIEESGGLQSTGSQRWTQLRNWLALSLTGSAW